MFQNQTETKLHAVIISDSSKVKRKGEKIIDILSQC